MTESDGDAEGQACTAAPSAYFGPRGFCWLVPGRLGGAAKPGLFKPIEHDLEALQRVGTRLLVTLTDEWEPEPARFVPYGIESLYMPVPDRGAPSPAQARELCLRAAAAMNRGEAVVYHCRAGRGRTGTMLAAQLIHGGASAENAIAQVRAANPYWIESDAQIAMLHAFADGA